MRNKLIYYILIFAFLIRLITCIFIPAKMDLDPQWYYDTALKIISEKSFNVIPIKPPFYPVFLSFVFSIFKPSIFIVQVVQCIIDCFTILFIYLFCKNVLGIDEVGVIASAISSIDPFLIYFVREIMPETLTSFLIISSCYFLSLGLIKNNFLSKLLGSVFVGLSMLTRGNILGVLPLMFLGGIVYFLVKKKLKEGIVSILVILFPATILVSGWIFRNWLVYGDATISFQRGVVWQGLNPKFETEEGCKQWDELLKKEVKWMKFKNDIEFDRYLWEKGKKMIKKNFGQFLYVGVKKLIKFFRPIPYYGYSTKEKIVSFVFFTPVLILFFIGLFTSFHLWDKLFVLYIYILNFLSFVFLAWVQIRYRIPLHPIINIFASYGVCFAYEKLFRKNK